MAASFSGGWATGIDCGIIDLPLWDSQGEISGLARIFCLLGSEQIFTGVGQVGTLGLTL